MWQNNESADSGSAQSAGSKRKSVDGAPESAKKQKTTASETTSNSMERQSAAPSVPSAPRDIHGIELPGQWSDDVPVYESCDQVCTEILDGDGNHSYLENGVASEMFFRGS